MSRTPAGVRALGWMTAKVYRLFLIPLVVLTITAAALLIPSNIETRPQDVLTAMAVNVDPAVFPDVAVASTVNQTFFVNVTNPNSIPVTAVTVTISVSACTTGDVLINETSPAVGAAQADICVSSTYVSPTVVGSLAAGATAEWILNLEYTVAGSYTWTISSEADS